MGIRWAWRAEIYQRTKRGIGETQPAVERWLWGIAVATFGVGDIVTTTVGQSLGLYETNPIFRALFEVFPVFPVMLLGMGLQLWLAGMIATRVDTFGRVVIPTILSLLGLKVVFSNSLAIASVL